MIGGSRSIDGSTVELQAYDSESRLLKELDFVVVDIEATGAKMPPNRIIELGAYRIRGGRIVDNFVTLVNPEISIPASSMALTGINERDGQGRAALRRGGSEVVGVCR